MTEQSSLFGPTLPPEFVAEWRRLEAEHRRAPVVLSPVEVRETKMGWWLIFDAGGKRIALVNRPDLTAAARDGFKMVTT